jgi:hypothetical protein
MNKADSRFDNFVLMVVVLIGLIFIGISLKAVNKNIELKGGQANAMHIIEVGDVSLPKPIMINGVCGTLHEWEGEEKEGFCEKGVVINKKIDGFKLFWECKGSGGGEIVSCYADKREEVKD